MTSLLSIKKLADRATSYMRTGQATSYPSAVRKAIHAEGITYEPDVKRLVKEVCAELGRRGAQAKKRKQSKETKPAHNPKQLLLPLK